MSKELIKKLNFLLRNFSSIKKYKGLRLRSEKDLAKIPITTREDLSKHSINDCPQKPVTIQRSSGTTASRKSYTFFSKGGYMGSLERFLEIFSYLKLSKTDVFLNGISFGELYIGSFLDQAAIMSGMTEIPLGEPGKVNDKEMIIDLIKNLKPAVIFSFPNQLYDIFYHIKKNHSIKRCIIAGELLLDEYVKIIRNLGGVELYDVYGCVEVGCAAFQINPRSKRKIILKGLYLEIMNKEGIFPEGEGEILITDLNNLSTPIIRYKVGDYGKIVKIKGRHFIEIYGRADSIININGELHPWLDLLKTIYKHLKHPYFCLFIKKEVNTYKDSVILVINKGFKTGGVARLKKEMEKKGVWLKIRFTNEPLPKTPTGKFIQFVDLRKKLFAKDKRRFSF